MTLYSIREVNVLTYFTDDDTLVTLKEESGIPPSNYINASLIHVSHLNGI